MDRLLYSHKVAGNRIRISPRHIYRYGSGLARSTGAIAQKPDPKGNAFLALF